MKFFIFVLALSNLAYAVEPGHLSFFKGQVQVTLAFDDGAPEPSLSGIPLMDIELRRNNQVYDTKSMSAVIYLTRAPNETAKKVYVAQQEGLCVPPIPGSYYASFPYVETIGNWTMALTMSAGGVTETHTYQFDVK